MEKLNITVPIGKVDGYNLLIRDNKEQLQSFWYVNKWYEAGMINFIHNNYKGGVFIDVGGSIGNHAVAFSKVADKVYTFEPITQHAFHLKANLLINNIDNVFLYNIALSDRNGIARLFNDDRSDGGGTITEDGELVVPVLKLDEFGLEDVKLIKIDVEGHEEQVIAGGIKTIKKNLPDMFIETGTFKEFKNMLVLLQKIDKRYKPYEIIFNNTPTTLFTIKKNEDFILNEDPRIHILPNEMVETFFKDYLEEAKK